MTLRLKLLGQEIELPANETSTLLIISILALTFALCTHITLVQASPDNIREVVKVRSTGDKPEPPTAGRQEGILP
jgi:hypothetical protein